MFFAIASTRHKEVNFSYYVLSVDNYRFLCEKYPEIQKAGNDFFCEAILYEIKGTAGQKAKVATISTVERQENTIKIVFRDIKDSEISCDALKKKLYAIQCNMGWKEVKGLYAFPLSAGQYNSLVFPSANSIKHSNKMLALRQMKLSSDWKGVLKLFDPLSEFQENYKDIWDDAERLDEITYFLAKLTEPSDRFRVKDYCEPFFLKFSERTIELEPGNLKYQSTLAYHFYVSFQTSKVEKDYLLAKPLYEKMISINPSDVTELYRFAKLNHFYTDANSFRSNFDYKVIGVCEKYYQEAISAYERIVSEDSKQWNKKNYISSIYNLIALYLDYYLNYDRAFFEIKLFKREKTAEIMLHQKKYDLLGEVKKLLEDLFVLSEFNLDTALDEIVNKRSTDKDQIDVMYRAALLYQDFAFVYNLLNKTDENNYKIYLDLSNQYIKKSFDLYHLRKNQNIRGIKTPFHLYGLKALNLYLSGQVEQAIESLLRGKEDGQYKAAQILCLEGRRDEAKTILDAIPQKSLMFNKAQYLKEFMSNV